MNTMLKRWNIRILIGILFSVAALAQSTGGDLSPKQASVSVPLFINDRKDHPVADIKQSDVAVLDNKQPARSILSLKKGSELPLRLGILIDVSNSERSSSLYQDGLKSASDFLNHVLTGPGDKVFFEKFSAKPEEPTEFMGASQLSSYRPNIRIGGATALFDAVDFACQSRLEADGTLPARRVLVILTDGDDNLSHITQDEAIGAAFQAGAVIFAVSTQEDHPGSRGNERNNKRLKDLAEITGGEVFLHLRPSDVGESFSKIREQIENMSALTFDPPEPNQKGFHLIELRFSGQGKTRVRAPKGYYLK